MPNKIMSIVTIGYLEVNVCSYCCQTNSLRKEHRLLSVLSSFYSLAPDSSVAIKWNLDKGHSISSDITSEESTVEPLNRGHFGTSHFVHYREVVLFSEV